MRIRYYGFLANACRLKKVAVIQQQQGPATKKQKQAEQTTQSVAWPCTECTLVHLTLAAIILPTVPAVTFANPP